MTAPVRRTTVPSAIGENRKRIRILEAASPLAPVTLLGQIVRDGSAPNLTIPSYAVLNQTTKYVDNFTIDFSSSGVTVDLANGTITAPVDGIYIAVMSFVWIMPSAATYGVSLSLAINDIGQSAGQVPYNTTTTIANDDLYQLATITLRLNAGDLVGMSVGQNSGSDKTQAGLATLWLSIPGRL